jgi:hypothetical protein
VAGNGGKKYAYQEKCAKQDASLGGEMKKRAARGHDNSPHLIIRIATGRDFTAWYRARLAKTGRTDSATHGKVKSKNGNQGDVV